MNYKPFSSEGKTILKQDYDRKKHSYSLQSRSHHTIKLNISQPNSVSDNKTERFRSRYYHWSKLGQGLFWGITITSLAIISAGFGAALTKIDAVEEVIARKILPHANLSKSSNHSTELSVLDKSLNILLIEVQPDNQSMVEFDPGKKSKSQKILVLKFDPHIGAAKITNIPLDSRVKLPKLGWGTIADAHSHGGTNLTTQMVEQLMNNVKIDRYIQTTPQNFQRLAASGKLTLSSCDARIQDCTSTSKQIEVQEKGFESIRQRLNIAAYFDNFEEIIPEIRPVLDSNISVQEFIAIAKFVKMIDQDKISINFLPNYTPGEMLGSKKDEINKTKSSVQLRHN